MLRLPRPFLASLSVGVLGKCGSLGSNDVVIFDLGRGVEVIWLKSTKATTSCVFLKIADLSGGMMSGDISVDCLAVVEISLDLECRSGFKLGVVADGAKTELCIVPGASESPSFIRGVFLSFSVVSGFAEIEFAFE